MERDELTTANPDADPLFSFRWKGSAHTQTLRADRYLWVSDGERECAICKLAIEPETYIARVRRNPLAEVDHTRETGTAKPTGHPRPREQTGGAGSTVSAAPPAATRKIQSKRSRTLTARRRDT